MSKNLDINTVVITGGNSKSMIANPPTNFVDLLVGTIGTINKLSALNIYKLDFVRHVVLDEADVLFDSTFKELLVRFLKKISVSTINFCEHNYKIK